MAPSIHFIKWIPTPLDGLCRIKIAAVCESGKLGSSHKSFAVNFLNDPWQVTEFPSLVSFVDKVTGVALDGGSFLFTDSTVFLLTGCRASC